MSAGVAHFEDLIPNLSFRARETPTFRQQAFLRTFLLRPVYQWHDFGEDARPALSWPGSVTGYMRHLLLHTSAAK